MMLLSLTRSYSFNRDSIPSIEQNIVDISVYFRINEIDSGPSVSYKGTMVFLYKKLAYSSSNHSVLFLANTPIKFISIF